jgi:hypothetical protein
MPGALPNTFNGSSNATTTDIANANASIQNYIKGINWPPVTNNDRVKMAAAITAFKAQINKVQAQSAKNAPGGTAAPAAAQLAAQQAPVNNSVPNLASYLPAGTDLSKTSFANAISTMQTSVTQMQALTKNPVGAAGGGREIDINQYVKQV